VLFHDEFTGDLAGWKSAAPLDPAGASPAAWSVRNGMLAQSGVFEEEGTSEDAVIVTAGSETQLSDFVMDVQVYATSGEPVGVVFRYSATGFYLVKLLPQGPVQAARATLLKVENGVARVVAESSSWAGYTKSSWQRLTVSAKGSDISVATDGQSVITATDSAFSSGGVGFYAYADGTARFDNLRVTAP
jgi:hypothetical protein